jgi:hypothetical protein
MSTPTPTHPWAFALGGLAGNNAHGAGFLQAALEAGVVPQMLSCTSGQILWACRFLQALGDGGAPSLRAQCQADVAAVQPTGEPNTDLALLGLFGKPGVFRPAYERLFTDWLRNAGAVVADIVAHQGRVLAAKEWLSLLPARSLVPQFPQAFFDGIAATLQGSAVGVAFNAYNPRSGDEHVYLNAAARRLLRSGGRKHYAPGTASPLRPYRTYQDIDAAAVRDGLWLYPYGFDQKASPFVDGAYFRGVMLAELARADVVFAVRPINHRWLGPLPGNYPAMEDLKTEVNFNGAYSAERDQLLLINRLLAEGALSARAAARYHPVALEEIEIDLQRGYFDYAMESLTVFDRAHAQAVPRLAQRLGVPVAA